MHNRRLILMVLCFCLAVSVVVWSAIQSHLAWDAPPSNVDGTPITEAILYKVYVCDAPIRDDKTCDGKMVTQDGITDLTYVSNYQPLVKKGAVYYRVSAYYEGGPESALSNMVNVPFDERGVPSAPANLKIVP